MAIRPVIAKQIISFLLFVLVFTHELIKIHEFLSSNLVTDQGKSFNPKTSPSQGKMKKERELNYLTYEVISHCFELNLNFFWQWNDTLWESCCNWLVQINSSLQSGTKAEANSCYRSWEFRMRKGKKVVKRGRTHSTEKWADQKAKKGRQRNSTKTSKKKRLCKSKHISKKQKKSCCPPLWYNTLQRTH